MALIPLVDYALLRLVEITIKIDVKTKPPAIV